MTRNNLSVSMNIQDAIPDQVDFSAISIADTIYPNSVKYDTEGRKFNRALGYVVAVLRKTRGVIEVKGKHLVFWADKTLF